MCKIITLPLGFSNAYLICDKETILFDTGINVTKEKYLEIFKLYGIDPHSINLLVISHGHVDHFADAAVLKEITNAPVLCHRNAARALYDGKNVPVEPCNELGENMLKLLGKKMPTTAKGVTADILMDDEYDLTPYGVAGRIVYTPGHTDCSVSVITSSGEVLLGDILVPSFFTGELITAYFANNEQALFESLKMLVKQAHTFYGGHGGPFRREEVLGLI